MAETNTLVIITEPLQYNRAPASRAWHIFRELNRNRLKTLLISREATGDSIAGDGIIAIRPICDNGFIGNLIFIFQISAVVMRILLSNRVHQTIIRGYNLAPLLLLLKLLGKQVIYDFHGFAYKEQIVEGRRLRAMITQPFDWLALRVADHIIAIKEEMLQDFRPGIRGKTILMPNGVDLEEFTASTDKNILAKYGLPADKKLVGFVGNWEPWIAIEDILHSAKYLADDTKVVIIGTGKCFDKYKAAYPSILFTGRIPHVDTVALLETMDICLQPCYNETILKDRSSRKILEYLAAGKPIIISDVDHKEKFLKEGENTLLYNVGDPKDLAEKIKTILNDGKLYNHMARNNLELAKRFSWREVISYSGLIKILQD